MFGKLPLLRTQRVVYEMAYGCAYLRDAHIEPAGAVEGSTGSLGNGLCCGDFLNEFNIGIYESTDIFGGI